MDTIIPIRNETGPSNMSDHGRARTKGSTETANTAALGASTESPHKLKKGGDTEIVDLTRDELFARAGFALVKRLVI